MSFSNVLCLMLMALCHVPSNSQLLRDLRTGQYLTEQDIQERERNKCSLKCEDEKILCGVPSMKSFCNHTLFGAIVVAKCPKMCGTCTPCSISARSCAGAPACEDQASNCGYLAPKYCHDPVMGYSVRFKCQKSCLVCKPCNYQPLPPCERECRDLELGCEHWAFKTNYCEGSIYSKWMAKNCRLSCKLCTKCATYQQSSTKVPTTARPTTEPNIYLTSKTTPLPSIGRCVRGQTTGVSIQDQCLNAHNYYRCLHGVRPLKYDFRLERGAQLYANRLPFLTEHKTSSIGYDRPIEEGENISWRLDASTSTRFSVNEAVAQWYAQGLDYDYKSVEAVPDSESFTQLLWRGTTTVGCALKKYKGEAYVVARYRTVGNVENEFFFNVPRPRSVCSRKCAIGSCQGNSGNPDDCRCDAFDYPVCTGYCVAKCKRPYGYFGEWIDSCEGSAMCTCTNERDHARGIPRGAMCN